MKNRFLLIILISSSIVISLSANQKKNFFLPLHKNWQSLDEKNIDFRVAANKKRIRNLSKTIQIKVDSKTKYFLYLQSPRKIDSISIGNKKIPFELTKRNSQKNS